MRPFPHRIRRQRWVVRARSAPEAFALRQHLRAAWQEALLPVFERAFDEMAPGSAVIRIPRIELRLRLPADQPLAQALPAVIYQQLQAQLRDLAPEVPQRAGASGDAIRLTGERNQLEALWHYLRTGSLSWDAAGEPASDVAHALTETSRRHWPELAGHLQQHRESEAFVFRLLQLLPANEAVSLVRRLSEHFPASGRGVDALLMALLAAAPPSLPPHARLLLAARFLTAGLSGDAERRLPDSIALAARRLGIAGKQAADAFVAALPPPMAARFKELMAGAQTELSAADSATATQGARASAVERSGVAFEGRPDDLDATEASARTDKSAALPGIAAPATADEFSVVVSYAGLILLHPFLPRFLEATGIVGTAVLALPAARLAHAAALLHFLATGREAIHEFELGFIKVLLGLVPEDALCVAAGLLSDSDRAESDTLLQAVIQHWAVLKNTSASSLRSTFLDRAGLLQETDDGWQLRVEGRAPDLLLDQLPWSLGAVRLPWMRRSLFTEWQMP